MPGGPGVFAGRMSGESKLAAEPPRLLDQPRILVSEPLHLSAQSRRFLRARRGVTEVVLSFAPVDFDLPRVGNDISPTAAGNLWGTFIGHGVHQYVPEA
jgi:hypothetical protein